MTPCTHPNCTGEARWSFDGRSVCRAHAVELAARGRPGRLLPDERPDVVARLRAIDGHTCEAGPELCHEAADEIERLRRQAGQAAPA